MLISFWGIRFFENSQVSSTVTQFIQKHSQKVLLAHCIAINNYCSVYAFVICYDKLTLLSSSTDEDFTSAGRVWSK